MHTGVFSRTLTETALHVTDLSWAHEGLTQVDVCIPCLNSNSECHIPGHHCIGIPEEDEQDNYIVLGLLYINIGFHRLALTWYPAMLSQQDLPYD